MKEFRELSATERGILSRLLERPFPGRDEIREQVNNALVRELFETGDERGTIEFRVRTKMMAPVRSRAPVQAIAYDEDGVPISIILHVIDGTTKELEFNKADGSPIVRTPSAAELEVEVRDD